MATHSSTLAWKIPWMEECGRLQSMGLMQGKIEGKRRRGQQRVKWLDGITNSMDMLSLFRCSVISDSLQPHPA